VPNDPPAEPIDLLLVWVYEPSRRLPVYANWNAEMRVDPHALVIRAKPMWGFGPRPMFDEIRYEWPTIVVERFRLHTKPLLLIDIEGRLGAAHFFGRDRLRRGLERAGFKILEMPLSWGWIAPHPVPREVLGEEVERLPGCVVAR